MIVESSGGPDKLRLAIERAADAYSQVSGAFHAAYYGSWSGYDACRTGECGAPHWVGEPNKRHKP